MWPFSPRQDHLVTIICNPQHIICSWFESTKTPIPLKIKAYKNVPLQHLECEGLIFFNPTRLKKIITNFITTHNLAGTHVSIALTGPSIQEKLVFLSHATPQKKDFDSISKKDWFFDSTYLYPHDNGQYVFYTAKIPQSLLYQIKSLAIACNIQLAAITTERMALLMLYKYIKGPTFRFAQLGQDMILHNNVIEEILSSEMFDRICAIDKTVNIKKQKEIPHLLSASGLFITRYTNHERN